MRKRTRKKDTKKEPLLSGSFFVSDCDIYGDPLSSFKKSSADFFLKLTPEGKIF